MTDAAITTPEAATARLDALKATPEWSGKLLAHDAPTVAEFQNLTGIIASDGAPAAGSAEAMASALARNTSNREFAGFVEGVRNQFPVNDAVIAQLAKGEPISQAEADLGRQWMEQLKGDPARTAKLMDGDTELKRQFFHASLLIASDVKQEKRS